jgi:hypothetical protein
MQTDVVFHSCIKIATAVDSSEYEGRDRQIGHNATSSPIYNIILRVHS